MSYHDLLSVYSILTQQYNRFSYGSESADTTDDTFNHKKPSIRHHLAKHHHFFYYCTLVAFLLALPKNCSLIWAFGAENNLKQLSYEVHMGVR
ncbi:hypothetical protein Hamer_G024555, partial [Homarus americanus]